MGANSKDVPAAKTALTADGTASGILTVTSTVGFYAGARISMYAVGQVTTDLIVTGVTDATHMTAKLAPVLPDYFTANGAANPTSGTPRYPNYGNSDLSGFHSAATWTVIMDRQFIYTTA